MTYIKTEVMDLKLKITDWRMSRNNLITSDNMVSHCERDSSSDTLQDNLKKVLLIKENSLPSTSRAHDGCNNHQADFIRQENNADCLEENVTSLLAGDNHHERPRGWGVRHTQALLVFCGLSISFMIRLDLAVAVVGMKKTDSSHVKLTPGEKGLIVSSFFMGYSILQIPAGTLGRKGYAIVLFSLANILSGVLCLLLPLAAFYFRVTGIAVLRFLTGMFQGFIYPNLNNIMSNWVVPEERDAIMCVVHTGNSFGSLILMVMAGFLNENFGWPSIFYATGSLGITFGILNITAGRFSPDSCKYISPAEKEYFKQSPEENPDEV